MKALDEVYRSVGWGPPGTIRTRDQFLLAWRDRTLEGSLMYWVESVNDEYEPLDVLVPYRGLGRFHIQEVAVQPAAQRSGVGRALMHATAQAAADLEIGWLWTWPQETSGDDTTSRKAFYRACGMSELRPPGERLEMVGATAAVLAATRGAR